MMMIHRKCYIIRKGDFAVDANKKIFYSLFSVALCLEDYRQKHSTDCFSIMAGSSIVWTLIETYLHVTNTRLMKPMYITRMNQRKILVPKPLAICLQGMQEGGVVTTFGLFFGDRLSEPGYLVMFHAFIGYILLNMSSKERISPNARVSSKRQVNTTGSLCLMGGITAYNIAELYHHPQHLQRQAGMFFAMIYVCAIWTLISYYKNFRGVEVQVKGRHTDHYRVRKSHTDALIILGYDVIFEIGVAYITFYNWFVL
jgi:hypothetical protein